MHKLVKCASVAVAAGLLLSPAPVHSQKPR